MNEYELIYIVTARRSADGVSEVIDRVAGVIGDAGGEVLSVNNWGRRRLAYPIKHEFEGNYVFTTLNLPGENTGVLEAALTISEDVIRHLLIRGIIPSDGSAPPELVGDRPRTMQAPAAAPPPAAAVAEAPEQPAEAPAEAGAATPETAAPAETPAVEPAEPVTASVEPAAAGEPAEATAPAEAAAPAVEAGRGDDATEQQPAEPSPAATSSE